ncbi:Helix-turn-helix domain protein [Poriferisphaera corsica]|uniref:Helix-turn-helix domain protein n=1 Tax=Poriferisphaera corsica TaxID=2528020 RepID=A0A517YPS1_9BACT|nr:helix-turn-helix domain-containing protein [Poriferisphaera corsica]QDU32211.1 Helix-turn-helix domain protein [Poriferisphaera corsica]
MVVQQQQSKQKRMMPLHYVNNKSMSEYLGVSTRTLYQLRRRGKDPMPSFMLGSRVFYILHDVDEWIKRQRENTATITKNKKVQEV